MTRCSTIGLITVFLGFSVGCGKKIDLQSEPQGTTPVTLSGGNKTTNPSRPAETRPESPEQAIKSLAGNWQVSAIQNLPTGLNEAYLNGISGVIEGDMLRLSKVIGYLDQGQIRIDPTKSPKQFDLISVDNSGKPRTVRTATPKKTWERPIDPVLGIYKLEGDRLVIAITDRENYRPTDFKPSIMENTGQIISINPDKFAATSVTIVELVRRKAEVRGKSNASQP